MKKELSLAKKLTYSAVITCLMFALAEGVVILSGFRFDPKYSIYVENRWTKLGVGQDPELPWNWVPVPGATCLADGRSTFQFNSLGYRGPNFQLEKSPEVIRIVCLGDSGTMGWGVKDEDTYCARLKDFIEAKCNKKVETINAGVLGYTSFQGLHQLRMRVVSLKPDFITICYNWNDHAKAIRMGDTSGKAAWEAGLPMPDKDLPGKNLLSKLTQKLSSLRLYQLIQYGVLRTRIKQARNPKTLAVKTDFARVPLEDYKENLTQMIQVARDNRFVPILLTQALNPNSLRSKNVHEAYNSAVVEIAREMNVPYVEARKLLGDDPTLFSSNTHPTRQAHKKIAMALARKLRPLIGCKKM